jgi:hypothetical protein
MCQVFGDSLHWLQEQGAICQAVGMYRDVLKAYGMRQYGGVIGFYIRENVP